MKKILIACCFIILFALILGCEPKSNTDSSASSHSTDSYDVSLYKEGLMAYQRKEHAESFPKIYPAALANIPEAQYKVGVMYDIGSGAPQNTDEAISWYQKSAEGGFISAQYKLGLLYEAGHGLPQNKTEAYKWYTIASSTKNDSEGELTKIIQDRALKTKKLAMKKFSQEQVSKGEKLAQTWLSTHKRE